MDYDANHEKYERYGAQEWEYDEDEPDVYDDKHQTMKTPTRKDETYDHFAEEGKL